MSKGVNKVIIIGNLGRDPETNYLPSGGAVTNIAVATSESWTDKQSGQKQERTEWHRVVFFNRLAEIAAEYLKKGSKVYIEGSLRTRKWQDKETGADRYSTEIIAANMQMLGSVNSGAQNQNHATQAQQGSGYAPQQQQGQQSAPQQQSQNQSQQQGGNGFSGEFDSEIPF